MLVQRTCNATIKVRTVAVGDPPPAATDPGIALYQHGDVYSRDTATAVDVYALAVNVAGIVVVEVQA